LAISTKSVRATSDVAALLKVVKDFTNSPPLSDALQWFVREKQWINEQHLQLCRIPASTFFEARRA
jgi:hypothetical protein